MNTNLKYRFGISADETNIDVGLKIRPLVSLEGRLE